MTSRRKLATAAGMLVLGFLADRAAGSRPGLLGDILTGRSAGKPEDAKKWVHTRASRPELAKVLEEFRESSQ